MAWIYLAESVDSQLLLESGSDQSPFASPTDTLRASYCPECDRVALVKPQYGTMCERSPGVCYLMSTLFMGDSPARTLVLPALVRAWLESEVDYLARLCAWPTNSSPLSYSSKTCQRFEHGDLAALGKNWPVPGMIVDGTLFPLKKLERRIKERGGSFWLTPTTSTDSNIKAYQARMKRKIDPKSRGKTDKPSDAAWRETQPSISRVADGIPFQLDRHRSLGNAVVPLQAHEAFKRLMGLE
jgi:hypothetical protein